MSFDGFPRAAIDFYQDLEDHNDRDWWLAHKATYNQAVRRPLDELIETLAPEFDAASTKIFRPNRDVRFSADKSPYKTHQGGYLSTDDGSAYYVQISGDGLLAGGGRYHFVPDQLTRYRAAVDEPTSGNELARIVAAARDAGCELHGEQMATRPRGVPSDHPQLELMRMKSLWLGRNFGPASWISTSACLDQVREAWDAARALVNWLDQCVGASELPERR